MPTLPLKLLHPVVSPGEVAQQLHEGQPISAVACSPDGRLLALGTHHGPIAIRDAETGETLHRLDGHAGRVHSCAFSPDSRWLLSAGLDGALVRWEIAGGTSEVLFAGAQSLNTCDLDGVRAVTGGDDGLIRLWDGQLAHTLSGHPGMLTGVALHPDGERIISGGIDGTVRLWKPTSGHSTTLYHHPGAITDIAITPDGATVLSAGTDGRLRVWDLHRGRLVGELHGHSGPITSCAIDPTGHHAVSGAIDRTVMTWDLRTGACHGTFTSHSEAVMGVAWGKQVWSASEDGMARAWDPTVQPAPPSHQLRHLDAVTGARLTGEQLLTVSADCTLRAWDINSGQCVQVLDGALDALSDISLSTDRRMLVTASHDGLTRLYRREERWQEELTLQTGPITVAAFLSEHALLTGGPSQPMQAWSLLSGRPLFTLGETGVVDFVVLSSSEIISMDVTTAPIRWSAGEPVGRLGDAPATAITAHADGEHIVIGRCCGSIEVWRHDGDRPVFRHTPHGGPVTAVAVLEDGRILSATAEAPLALWTPTTDRCITIATHGTIQTLDVRAGLLVAGDDTGNVWLFAIPDPVRAAA